MTAAWSRLYFYIVIYHYSIPPKNGGYNNVFFIVFFIFTYLYFKPPVYIFSSCIALNNWVTYILLVFF